MQRPLWKCPRCGHRFVTRNIYHSCGRYRIADHFAGKAPAVRKSYRKFSAMVRKCGPVTVYAEKTRIVFMVRVRFAGAIPRKQWLDCGFWLRRRIDHSRFHRIQHIVKNDYGYFLRITDPAQLDDEELQALLQEAYSIGCQQPVKKQGP